MEFKKWLKYTCALSLKNYTYIFCRKDVAWYVVLGKGTIKAYTSEEIIKEGVEVDTSHNHPQWDEKTVVNDLALLKLKKSVTIGKEVNIATLPNTYTVKENTEGEIFSWGYKGDTKDVKKTELVTDLHSLKIKTLSEKDCKDVFKDVSTK